VVSARLFQFDLSGSGCSTWDCPGLLGDPSERDNPDPYIRERALGYRTAMLSNTLDPAWNEVVAAGLSVEDLARPFTIEVVDDDGSLLNANDLVATFEIQLRPEEIAPGRLEFRTRDGRSTLVMEIR